MPGAVVGMQDLNFKAGEITTAINDNFNKAVEIKQFLDGIGHAGLVAMGFSAGDADILISAFNDLEASKIQFDTSAFVKQLYGLGFK